MRLGKYYSKLQRCNQQTKIFVLYTEPEHPHNHFRWFFFVCLLGGGGVWLWDRMYIYIYIYLYASGERERASNKKIIELYQNKLYVPDVGFSKISS